MTENPVPHLSFSETTSLAVQNRMAYAFRHFCAIYGLLPGAQTENSERCVQLRYGRPATGSNDIALPATYRDREFHVAAPPPIFYELPADPLYARFNIASFPCFHRPCARAPVDWLAEIFEWLSCADEFAVTDRDEVGRLPYAATLHGRYKLDPTLPYAAIAMREFARSLIRGGVNSVSIPPNKPWNGATQSLIAASHDLDFLPISTLGTAQRLVKNIAIALANRDYKLAVGIGLSGIAGLVRRRSPLDYLGAMIQRERSLGIKSTCTVICQHGHRRDANYRLEDPKIQRILQQLKAAGVEIAVHGSYASLQVPNGLRREFEKLEACGFRAQGARQHWLRYAGSNLFDALMDIGIRYDTTSGFADRAGFRAGACFPYVPYDFAKEKPYTFLEIPLAIMDGALYSNEKSGARSGDVCRRVIDISRSFGWGGISVLWHNTVFEGAQLPKIIGDLYWHLKEDTDQWTTASKVADIAWPRFTQAGLLQDTVEDTGSVAAGTNTACA